MTIDQKRAIETLDAPPTAAEGAEVGMRTCADEIATRGADSESCHKLAVPAHFITECEATRSYARKRELFSTNATHLRDMTPTDWRPLPGSYRPLRDGFQKLLVTRRSFLHVMVVLGVAVLTAKMKAFGAPSPRRDRVDEKKSPRRDPVDDWWLIPEEDISWWPVQARPSVLGEQLYKAHDIGPRDAPEPDRLQEGATVVSTFAALQAAVNAAKPGDVIALEGGVTFVGGLTIPNIGTAESPVIIRANPNDEDQAILFDGYAPFITPDSAQWELVEGRHSGKKIWRSTTTFARGGNYVFGQLVRASDGAIIYLFPYQEAHFFSSSYGAAGYRGPGVYHDGTRLYIRLENPDEFQSDGVFDVIPTADEDPNDHVIYVGPNANYPIHVTGGAAFFRMEDIIAFGGPVRGTAGGSGWDFLRCQINTTNGGFSLRNASYTNFTFRYGAVRTHFGQWFDRDEHKSTTRGYRDRMHTVLFDPNEGTPDNCWFEDSRITDLTDGIFGGGRTGHNSGTIRCYQRYIDDVTQAGGTTSHIEHARNHIVGPGFAWGTGGNSLAPGNHWYHHNVINLDWGILWQYTGITSIPRRSRGTLTTHGSIGNHPLKLYNNTIIGGGYNVLQTKYRDRTTANSSGIPHYVLNNVLYQCNTRVPSTSITFGGDGQTDRDIRVDGATDRYNGNAWGRDTPHGGANLISVRRSPSDQTSKAWVSLAAFKADTSWSNGGTYNYETNGADIVGGRDEFKNFAAGDFQPKHDSSIAGMTPVDLTSFGATHGWDRAPDNDSKYVGAIPPEAASFRSDVRDRKRDRRSH